MAGLCIVYTGDGKGKTTAALGALIRTLCTGGSAAMVQFMKGDIPTAECDLTRAYPGLVVHRAGSGFFTDERSRTEQTLLAAQGLAKARGLIDEKYDLIVLDEINNAAALKLISIDDVNSLIDARGDTHIILTGRNAHSSFIERADIATEMRMIKHHYSGGAKAVKGIDL